MIKNLVGSILVVLGLSNVSNGYAVDIQNGKIVDHREWKTGKNTIMVQDVLRGASPRSNELTALENAINEETNPKNEFFFVKPIVAKKDQGGVVGQPIDIFATTNVFIMNSSGASKTYEVSSQFCLFGPDKSDKSCVYSVESVALESGKTYQKNLQQLFSPVVDVEGNYIYSLSLVIIKNDAGYPVTSFSSDSGSVSVAYQ